MEYVQGSICWWQIRPSQHLFVQSLTPDRMGHRSVLWCTKRYIIIAHLPPLIVRALSQLKEQIFHMADKCWYLLHVFKRLLPINVQGYNYLFVISFEQSKTWKSTAPDWQNAALWTFKWFISIEMFILKHRRKTFFFLAIRFYVTL